MKDEEDNLDGFGFESGKDTFFAESNPTIETNEVMQQATEDNVVIITPAVVEQKETVKVEDKNENPDKEEEGKEKVTFFQEEEEVKSAGEENEENQEPADKVVSSKSTLLFLKEKGLIDYELEEGTELTNELAEEILEDSYEDSIEAGVEEKIKGLPDFLKNMIKVAVAGGNVSALISNIANQTKTGITKDTDMTVEENQVLMMQHNLGTQGYDKEYIDTQIQMLKDTNKLELIATKAKEKFDTDTATQDAALVQRELQAKEKAKEDNRAYKAEVTTFVQATDNIKGLVINKKTKDVLPSFMSDLSVKMKDGRVITPYQEKLFAIFGDKEKNTLLATLVMNDFDFTSISNKTITEFSNGIRDNINNNKQSVKIEGSKRSSQAKPKKELHELIG